jgi:hypothetical protein
MRPSGIATEARGNALASAVIGAFLAVQLVLPLRGLYYEKLDTRANFSWNMYSQHFECRMSYLATLTDGTVVEIDHARFFNRGSRAQLVFHRDVLPAYHEYVCAELRRDDEFVRLAGICLCAHNSGEFEPLIRDDVDLCSVPRFGVLDR